MALTRVLLASFLFAACTEAPPTGKAQPDYFYSQPDAAVPDAAFLKSCTVSCQGEQLVPWPNGCGSNTNPCLYMICLPSYQHCCIPSECPCG